MTLRPMTCVRVLVVLAAGGVLAVAATPPLAPVAAPEENPPTEAKRVLGKMLFWDEQLSSDDTMSCGTCHVPDDGGADPRRGAHPGADGVFGTADDVVGSPAMVHQDAAGNFVPHAVFGLAPQVTGRAAPSFLTGALADTLFWDGRASSKFVDPQTGRTSIAARGALESQAVGPVLSSTEMSREGRTWDDVAAKLAARAPLALSTDVPPDVAAALTDATRYPELFAAAFGDGAITAERIAAAIATYERTLVPDQTPWDRFIAGDSSAMDAPQRRGWTAFQQRHCADCHAPPEFTDRSFRNIGLRPSSEDLGLANTTKDAADRGKFKVPSLRGAAVKPSHTHTGRLAAVSDLLRFYARAPGVVQFTADQDPIVAQIVLPPDVAGDVQAFVEGGLADARVAAEQFPFDYPTTYSEKRIDGPDVEGAGRAGQGGVSPEIVAPLPPFLGNADFRVGVQHGRAGAVAWLAVSSSPPKDGVVAPEETVGPTTLSAGGYATLRRPLPDDRSRDGERVWFQWRVRDDAAAGGVALSSVASATLFAVKTTAAAKAAVVSDTALFVSSAEFSLGAPGGDSFAAQGAFGAPTPAAESTFVLAFGGVEAVRATLDADGRASSARGSTPRWSVRVDAATGRFSATAAGLDLRAAAGLDSFVGRGTIAREVRATLGAATSSATAPFRWTTDARGVTRGVYRYAKDGLRSGAFVPGRAVLRLRKDGTRTLNVEGALDPAADAPFVPTGDVTVRIGGTEVVLASIVVRRGGSRASSAAASLTWRARTRTFSLECAGLPDVLGAGAADAAGLDVSISAATAAGDVVFDATVALKRVSETIWRR